MAPEQFSQPFLPVIDAALRQHRHRDCLVFRDQTFSYGDVDRLSAKVANQLRCRSPGWRPFDWREWPRSQRHLG